MRALLISALVIVLPVAAFAAEAQATAEIVEGATAQKINAAMIEAVQKGFGGALLIEVKGVPILKSGYGFANRERKTSFTADTIAQIGSITKPMTAMAILQLAEAGRLDVNARVDKYLPGAPEPAASRTLHQLLTHHGGLTDTCGDDFDVLPKAEFLRRCLAIPLAHPAAEDHYSNMGFSILAAIVEQVSGQSWDDYLRGHVWTPLGMNRTGFTHFAVTDTRAFAAGYLNDAPQGNIADNMRRLGGNDWNIRGNGGIQASTTDMERFYRGLTQKIPGVSSAVIAGMTTPRERIEGEAWEGYGLAVRLDANGRPFRIGHSGSDGTFFSYFGMLPQQDVFIYIVGNNGEENVRPLVQMVLKAVLEAYAPAAPKPGG